MYSVVWASLYSLLFYLTQHVRTSLSCFAHEYKLMEEFTMNRKSKKMFALTMSALMTTSFALAGCSGDEAGADGKVELTFMFQKS